MTVLWMLLPCVTDCCDDVIGDVVSAVLLVLLPLVTDWYCVRCVVMVLPLVTALEMLVPYVRLLWCCCW